MADFEELRAEQENGDHVGNIRLFWWPWEYQIVLVAKRIGDTVPVVMRTYAHLYPNKQQELVSRLETLSIPSSFDEESDLMPLG